MTQRVWVSWSSGKDSALALHETLADAAVEVAGLMTTVSSDRVAMHGVRRQLLDQQAAALGLPLHVVELPWPCPNDVYERRTAAAFELARAQDVTAVVFGDLFLEDIRAYRESTLAGTGLEPRFPLWGRPTAALARTMVDVGIRAVLVCTDLSQLPGTLCGRAFDLDLLADLPAGADPCGENGEFHTFVTDSPDFSAPVAVRPGARSERDGFAYVDLVASSG
jgi:uncharacterized protein (TIGR00290 family)